MATDLAVREEGLGSDLAGQQRWGVLSVPVIDDAVKGRQEGFRRHIHQALPRQKDA